MIVENARRQRIANSEIVVGLRFGLRRRRTGWTEIKSFDDPCTMHKVNIPARVSAQRPHRQKKVQARAARHGTTWKLQFSLFQRQLQDSTRPLIVLQQINIAIMDSSKVLSLLDQLDDEVDDLEEALAPLLKAALAETSSKLPLLDKAKLYTLVTYAIESLLFCTFHPSTLFAFLTGMHASISTTSWHQGARTSCLYRAHQSQAVL